MIKKRLVGVVTVKDGWAVQSMGYQRHLPMGKPEVVIENLDRWGADEILVQCIDRTRHDLGPDLKLLERISRKGLSTPLIYVGGIRNVAEGVAAIQAGAERIGVDTLLRDDPRTAAALAEPLGAQALIAVLPLAITEGMLGWLDHRNGQSTPVGAEVAAVLKAGALSEALIVDWRHEGKREGFDTRLLDRFPVAGMPLIAFGGLCDADQLRAVLERPTVVAAGVGNFLSYREHAVQHFKQQLLGLPLRPATYAAPSWA